MQDNNQQNHSRHRKRGKNLGAPELIAIALGGGIFTILGVSASLIGAYTPVAIAIGAVVAALAAYSYVKLGIYYRDEGATYSFCKKTFPDSPFAASVIGWWVILLWLSQHPGAVCLYLRRLCPIRADYCGCGTDS